jgi:hypothetical protein
MGKLMPRTFIFLRLHVWHKTVPSVLVHCEWISTNNGQYNGRCVAVKLSYLEGWGGLRWQLLVVDGELSLDAKSANHKP